MTLADTLTWHRYFVLSRTRPLPYNTIKINHPAPEEDCADDISAIVFRDAYEDGSLDYDHSSLASIPDHISRDVVEYIHTPIVDHSSPIVDLVGSVLDFVGDVEVTQFFGPINRQNEVVAPTIDLVEEPTVVFPAAAPVEAVEVGRAAEEDITGHPSASPIESKSYEEDDSDLGDIIDGYYSTSLADKKGCLYVSLPYKVANVISEPEPVKVQIAKPAAFKLAAFGSIPLLDQNLIDEFIQTQGAPRRKQRADDVGVRCNGCHSDIVKEVIEEYLKVLSKHNLENRIDEIDIAGVLSEDCKCSVIDSSSSGLVCSAIGSSSSESGCSVMGVSHSDNSSSPTTPNHIQAACISADAEPDKHHKVIAATSANSTPVTAFHTSPTIATPKCQTPTLLIRYRLNSEYRRFYTSSRPSGIPVRQRTQSQALSQSSSQSTPPRPPFAPAHFVMRWLNGMPHGSISSPTNIRANSHSPIPGSPPSSLRSIGKI
ncbi:hypothetical protein JR316_0011568 [Psilocybe cubensis]|uniref:Uncharacterized protein n=1 Tax=Psilocybe cubensis TaxID=181762 RepID=A0ACB8GJZ5_PSICU|nr:hypothetical protein JR316_0011568 [Psilocybe cubensis]KAH9476001.1 hypothetical protein JR316_0011568 [Psilocybe cubensis]